MNLIADIGNTSWKIALFDGTTMVKREEAPNGDRAFLSAFLGDVVPDIIGFSSVRVTSEAERDLFAKFGKVNTFFFGDTLPITLDYETPVTLGTDRIAAAVFAADAFPERNSLVIVIGSCITCDVVSADKQYLGGTISPGPQMRLNAMHHFTGKLPEREFNPAAVLPGKSSTSSMEAGAYYGILAEVEFYIDYYKQQYHDLNVIVSGGFVDSFEKKIKYPIFAQKDIVLRGLNEILNFKLEQVEK